MRLEPNIESDLLAAVRLTRSFLSRAGDAGSASPLPTGQQLEQLLYTLWFTRAGSTAPGPNPADSSDSLTPSLVARLRSAHAASTRFERGWTAINHGDAGVVVAERNGQHLEVMAPDYVNLDHPGTPIRAGDQLAVTARRDSADTEIGWWVTSGTAGPAPATDMLRIYWNCPVELVTQLVSRVTGALEAIDVPYTLKCPIEAEQFDRVEPLVLYMGFDQWGMAKRLLREIHASLSQDLRPAVPPLTLALGRGTAAAEDPSNGQSFGQSRARAVADGLAVAAAQGLTEESDTLAVITQQLAAHGISPTQPYQNAASPANRLSEW